MFETTYTYKGIRYRVGFQISGRNFPETEYSPREFVGITVLSWKPVSFLSKEGEVEDYSNLNNFEQFLVENHCLTEYLYHFKD